MNPLQKRLLSVGMLVFVGLGLCPPWNATERWQNRVLSDSAVGHYFIFDPPRPKRTQVGSALVFTSYNVDMRRLAVLWLGLVVLTLGAAYLVGGTHNAVASKGQRRATEQNAEGTIEASHIAFALEPSQALIAALKAGARYGRDEFEANVSGYDQFVKTISAVLRRHFSEETARFDGNKFAVIVREVARHKAEAGVRAVRAELSRTSVWVVYPDGRSGQVPVAAPPPRIAG